MPMGDPWDRYSPRSRPQRAFRAGRTVAFRLGAGRRLRGGHRCLVRVILTSAWAHNPTSWAQTVLGRPKIQGIPGCPKLASSRKISPEAPMFVQIRALSAGFGADFQAIVPPDFGPITPPRPNSSGEGPEPELPTPPGGRSAHCAPGNSQGELSGANFGSIWGPCWVHVVGRSWGRGWVDSGGRLRVAGRARAPISGHPLLQCSHAPPPGLSTCLGTAQAQIGTHFVHGILLSGGPPVTAGRKHVRDT